MNRKQKNTKVTAYVLFDNNIKFIEEQAKRTGLSSSCYLRLLLNRIESERKLNNGTEKITVEL